MDDKITLEDVRRLDVRPGETLLVTVRSDFTPEQARHVVKQFQEAFPKVRIVIVIDEIDVEVVVGASDAQDG